jgi:DNA-binding NtrC family response regulator
MDEAALRPVPPVDWTDPVLGRSIVASIHAAYVGLFLATGRVFDAGQRARALLRAVEADDCAGRAIAATAHLGVLAASGDLHLAEEQWRNVCDLSRQARAPLLRVRAALVWIDAMARAGRARDAQRLLDAQGRMIRVTPPQLRSAIEHRLSRLTGAVSDAIAPPSHPTVSGDAAATLVHLVHAEDEDSSAVRALIARLARDLSASRVEVLSAAAGPVSVVAGVGAGLPTELGGRILEAGISITSARDGRGCEMGVPMRWSSRLVGALVCRWPMDRQPPPQALDVLALGAAIGAPRVDGLVSRARETAMASTAVPELIGASAAIAEVRRSIERAARAPFAVLIEGESGVGKELAARAIHQLSARRERRFCDVNCAALPDELLESELFGHARGAFTGALSDKAGLIEEADGGTLFLDEVADLSPRAQAKLLRVIQQQEIRRVGETFARKVDVRLVTAANRDMRREATERRFRADLLYRLDVIHVWIPPLRDRPEDIPILAQHFWRTAAERVGSMATLTSDVIAALARHPWPGNVRELQNVMSALAVAAPSRGRIRSSLLPPVIAAAAVPDCMTLCEARVEFERRFIEAALARAGGSRTRAAQALGVSRQGLLKTMARLRIAARADREPCDERSGA